MNAYTSQLKKLLVRTKSTLQTKDNKPVEVWELQSALLSNSLLSAWAKHFREHYCKDSEIDSLRSGTNLARKDYLNQLIFPDKTSNLGPSTRAGDFGEILVADFLEFLENYEVLSRLIRYSERKNPNISDAGSDIVGFRFVSYPTADSKDELAVFEAKAKFTGSIENAKVQLQKAIDDSAKDKLRIAYTLNAMKQRLSLMTERMKVERFQNEADYPYNTINGAVAIVCNSNYSDFIATNADASQHINKSNLRLIIIKGIPMMDFIHELYRRAADEA